MDGQIDINLDISRETHREGGFLWMFGCAPLLMALFFCAGQMALLFSRPDIISADFNPFATADYAPWDYIRIARLDPAIITAAAEDYGTPTLGNVLSLGNYVATPTPSPTIDPLVASNPSNTPTSTFTDTAVPSITPTALSTSTGTVTATFTATNTPPATATFTFTPTFTATNTGLPTSTSTFTPTFTPPATATFTFTPPFTPTFTFTPAPSPTPTPLFSPTNTATATFTFTPLPTSTFTDTPTATSTNTLLPTLTFTDTPTATFTPTETPTNTATFTATFTETPTEMPTNTATFTPTPTNTPVGCIGTGSGLNGTYFSNSDLSGSTFTRIDSTVNFNWGTGVPAFSIDGDTFSVRWTGEVEACYSETYTFYTRSDDGVRVWVNGALVIDSWIDQNGTIERSGTITLTAGVRYPIVVEFYENTVNALVELRWSSASQAKVIIPSTQLYPAAAPLTSTPTATPMGLCPTGGEPNVGSPNGVYCKVPANSSIVVDLGTWIIPSLNVYDLVYYEHPAGGNSLTDIALDRVRLDVSPDGSSWSTVFNYGDGAVDGNSNIAGYTGGAETHDQNIPYTALYGTPPYQTGIAINIDAVAPNIAYRYVRIVSGVDCCAQLDALQVLSAGAPTDTPTATFTATATNTATATPTDTATATPTPTFTDTPVASADLMVSITGNNPTVAGETITLTVSYGNIGPDTALNTEVLVTILGGMVYIGNTCPGTSSFLFSTVSCNLGNLINGQNGSFTISVAANATSIIPASISSMTADPIPADNSSSVTITVP